MKGWKLISIVLLILTISGCAGAPRRADFQSERNQVINTYLASMSAGRKDAAEAIKENLRLTKSYGYVQPYVPVISAPLVKRIWCPNHKSKKDADTLVAGHWVYVMVRGPKWFIEIQEGPGKFPVIVPRAEGQTEN